METVRSSTRSVFSDPKITVTVTVRQGWLTMYKSFSLETRKSMRALFLLTGFSNKRVNFIERIWTFREDKGNCLHYRGVRVKRVSLMFKALKTKKKERRQDTEMYCKFAYRKRWWNKWKKRKRWLWQQICWLLLRKKKFQRMKQMVVVGNKQIFKFTNGKFDN